MATGTHALGSGVAGFARQTSAQEEAPCPLFRRVQKRDATIVDFNPEKITDAIFKAAHAVGGKDRSRAEVLTQYVILELADRFQASTNLLHIEQIQDSIERVLMRHGHYRTSRAFITYRDERARRRLLKGESGVLPIPHGQPPLLRETSVWTSSGERVRWDREQIVKALVRETRLPYEEARRVSYAVELEIIHSKISHLTAPLIRELTNVQLLQMGYEAERRLHSRLGLPVYDIEQRLLEPKAAPPSHSIEAEILRQYAVEKVYPVSVSEAHGKEDLHLHHLEWIHRPFEIVRGLENLEPSGGDLPSPLPDWDEDTDWDGFLGAWETLEKSLVPMVGSRLIWKDVNSAIAFHARGSSIEARKAVRQALHSTWPGLARSESSPCVVWRLSDRVGAEWKRRSIGARQLSLLPEDDLENACRGVLTEVLRQAREGGAAWMMRGFAFEVVLGAEEGAGLDEAVVSEIARCFEAGTPLRVLFRRDSAVSRSRDGHGEDLLNVATLNFPRAASAAEGTESTLIEWLEDRLTLIFDAHLAKRRLLERLVKAGGLGTLGEFGASSHGLNLDRGIFGVGVWGLHEMTMLHRGEADIDDDETIRWLLKILARLDLRIAELGARSGLAMRLVSGDLTEVADRFLRPLAAVNGRFRSSWANHLVDSGNLEDDWPAFRSEGKLHSFFAPGQSILTVDAEPGRSAKEWSELLQRLATQTHVGGLAATGDWSYCGDCRSRGRAASGYCELCGGDSVFRIRSRDQGKNNTAVRF